MNFIATYKKFLTDHLERAINQCAYDQGLSLEELKYGPELAESLANFIEKTIIKYVEGQKKHGGDLLDRDMDFELEQELIDAFVYHAAKKWKKQL